MTVLDESLAAHWKTFGKFLKPLVEEANLTLTEFAQRCGMTLTQASRIVNGQSGTRRPTLPRIINALELTDRSTILELYTRAGFSPHPQFLLPDASPAQPSLTYEPADDEEEVISFYRGIPPNMRPAAKAALKALRDNLRDQDGPTFGRRVKDQEEEDVTER